MSGDSDPLSAIEAAFFDAGQACRDLLLDRPLSHAHVKTLVKWLYGCMNQRYTIRGRVERYGDDQIDKATIFVARAWAVVQEIADAENEAEGEG